MSSAESVLMWLVVAAHGVAAVVALLQLVRSPSRFRRLLWLLVVAGVLLDALWLALRGYAIRGFPLTNTGEACVFLALLIGVFYLLVGPSLDRVWFSSVMVWIISGLAVAGVAVARPAVPAQAVASTPWAIAHAITMILSAGAVMFAAANSILYLLASHRLKHKKLMQVLGRIPNMETLGTMNRTGLRIGFVLLTAGLATGLGLISSLNASVVEWLADGKVIFVLATWSLLGVVLVLDHLSMLKEKMRAYATLVALALVLIAILGVAIVGVTRHEFSRHVSPATLSVAV